jgi:hypothetical protein
MRELIIGLEVDQSDADNLISKIEEAAGIAVSRFDKSNIDGTASSALLYFEALSPFVAAIAPIVLHFLSNRRIRKIKVGDVEIENPSEEQVKSLLEKQ